LDNDRANLLGRAYLADGGKVPGAGGGVLGGGGGMPSPVTVGGPSGFEGSGREKAARGVMGYVATQKP